MTRKRSASRRSSGSSSNSSSHLARAALEAIQRVYTSRSVQISPSASPTSTTRESFEPAPSDTLSSMHSSSSTITPPAGYPTAHHQTAPAPTERTPLLSTFSPVVSPLGPSKSFSPGHTHPPEPFPDLEPGPGSPSDSSYEGLDVFGTHQPRRRWDLGASGGGGGQLRQNKRCEAWDACLLIYFFAVFVLVTVGGGAVLFWVLLHQS
ncbi:uncharacterized protein CC84DRAFT_655706 [Paraphaeosphaeria sporulosa]|uniref:Uncharacterized protein n=1 Tax=Paraphaeosphaeria sporulosa TaxID=1460663 RepID=A0A177CKP3_9PLEO|nr:uncharacterized protein CC84DRAFT_655706 [Paraphaeosphaeria sporulosa]OAG07367.1 hypothetical protein CC84DRAFT_655706 [Paraphaeosphaeria sporulosa]